MNRYVTLQNLGDGTYGSVVLGQRVDTGEKVKFWMILIFILSAEIIFFYGSYTLYNNQKIRNLGGDQANEKKIFLLGSGNESKGGQKFEKAVT